MCSRLLIFISFVSLAFSGQVLGYAQHPGAYSSPHYAKKAAHYNSQQYNKPGRYPETEYQKISQADLYENSNSERSKHQEIDIPDNSNDQADSYSSNTFENYTNEAAAIPGYYGVDGNEIAEINGTESQSGRSAGGFMDTAGNFLNGRGGQMLADIARELISRSTGASSQVLSLNLTNLVILIVLKALILAAGMFGAGAWTHGYGRSLESDANSQWVSGAELELWASYLQGRPECLGRVACLNPAVAKRYCAGADIALTTAKLMNGIVPYDQKYEKLVEEAKEAAAWGAAGMKCEDRYKC